MSGASQNQRITPVQGPIRGTVTPPGSKSITNRALVVAAVADGTTRLTNLLDSQDTRVMIESLSRLGIEIDVDHTRSTATVHGSRGRLTADQAELWLENSGTSIRFLTAMCATSTGRFKLDGNQRMRERPIGDLVAALRQLGVQIEYEANDGYPPLTLVAGGLHGGAVEIAANVSSQFLSGLLLAAPLASQPLRIRITGSMVSHPYVEMTLRVMSQFGVSVDRRSECEFEIAPACYRGIDYVIEPDASAASYFLAAAAITGGSMTIPGLSRDSLQGDVRFADALAEMGCQVEWQTDSVTVHGKPLKGIDIDMNAISDTAQTLAAVAVFAAGPTTIRNVEHMRHKETDRVAAVATELQKLGIDVVERADGMTIHPGPLRPATIATYDDHRMAMSFALIGLKSPGIEINDPGCTAKTYPHFFEDLAAVSQPSP